MIRTASFVSILLVILCLPDAHAVKDPEAQYNKLQKEIKKREDALERAKEKEHSILKEIELANRELSTLKKDIRLFRQKLNGTEKEIASVRAEMRGLSKKLNLQQNWLKRKLQAMQRYGNHFSSGRAVKENPGSYDNSSMPSVIPSDLVVLFLTSDDMPQAIRRWRYLKSLAEYEYNLLKDYSDNLKGLKEKEARLAGLIKRLGREREELLKKEESLREQKNKKNILLASIRQEKEMYMKMLSELRESSRQLQRIIEESAKTEYTHEGFQRMKGRLSWPVSGQLALPYGSYRDPEFNTPVFRNGIHIKSLEDDMVKAVYSGKVAFADWFKGYGRVVIINHGEGYHTVYANLNEIFLNKGDIIKRGDVIGKVGESGTLNAPGLYFEVRYRGKPLNPLHWLRKGK